MSYDFDGLDDCSSPVVKGPVYGPRDLELLVMLLELAAIYLSPEYGATFTRRQLLDQVHEIAGNDCAVDERDVQIVLRHVTFLRRGPGQRLSLK